MAVVDLRSTRWLSVRYTVYRNRIHNVLSRYEIDFYPFISKWNKGLLWVKALSLGPRFLWKVLWPMNSPDSNLERTLLETIPLFAKAYYGCIILEFIPFKIISSVDHLSGGEKISCLKLSGNKGTRRAVLFACITQMHWAAWMLTTDFGDEICWWQVWKVGVSSPTSYILSSGANIEKFSPTFRFYRLHFEIVANITVAVEFRLIQIRIPSLIRIFWTF